MSSLEAATRAPVVVEDTEGRERHQHSTRAGIWLCAIGILHNLVGVAVAARWVPDPQMDPLLGERIPILELLSGGVQRTGQVDTLLLSLFWFFCSGLLLMMLGSLIATFERRCQSVPKSAGYQLAAFCVLGGFTIPASGFWLGLIPAWLLIRRGA